MVDVIQRIDFDSAEAAFAHLGAGSAPFSPLVVQKLRELSRRLGVPIETMKKRSASHLMHDLLDDRRFAGLSSKDWNSVQFGNTGRVCFFSDEYHIVDLPKALEFAAACQQHGIDVQVFEWTYPGRSFADGYRFPSAFTIIGNGYKKLYRGKLLGFVV